MTEYLVASVHVENGDSYNEQYGRLIKKVVSSPIRYNVRKEIIARWQSGDPSVIRFSLKEPGRVELSVEYREEVNEVPIGATYVSTIRMPMRENGVSEMEENSALAKRLKAELDGVMSNKDILPEIKEAYLKFIGGGASVAEAAPFIDHAVSVAREVAKDETLTRAVLEAKWEAKMEADSAAPYGTTFEVTAVPYNTEDWRKDAMRAFDRMILKSKDIDYKTYEQDQQAALERKRREQEEKEEEERRNQLFADMLEEYGF